MNRPTKQGCKPRFIAFVALGSNMAPQRHLGNAYRWLGALGQLLGASSVYRTPPWGGVAQPHFWNGVLLLHTALAAHPLLNALLALEQRAKRAHGVPNGPRTLDLDLLNHSNSIVCTSALTLPHPRLHERGFVLRPLADIAPHWQHPKLGVSTTQMLESVDCRGIEPLHWHWDATT